MKWTVFSVSARDPTVATDTELGLQIESLFLHEHGGKTAAAEKQVKIIQSQSSFKKIR